MLKHLAAPRLPQAAHHRQPLRSRLAAPARQWQMPRAADKVAKAATSRAKADSKAKVASKEKEDPSKVAKAARSRAEKAADHPRVAKVAVLPREEKAVDNRAVKAAPKEPAKAARKERVKVGHKARAKAVADLKDPAGEAAVHKAEGKVEVDLRAPAAEAAPAKAEKAADRRAANQAA